jgi:hypothetical protein
LQSSAFPKKKSKKEKKREMVVSFLLGRPVAGPSECLYFPGCYVQFKAVLMFDH